MLQIFDFLLKIDRLTLFCWHQYLPICHWMKRHIISMKYIECWTTEASRYFLFSSSKVTGEVAPIV